MLKGISHKDVYVQARIKIRYQQNQLLLEKYKEATTVVAFLASCHVG
jgi:hypothetical protein